MLIQRNGAVAFDRSAGNGFRCAEFGTTSALPAKLLAPVEIRQRDNRTAKAVSDEVFNVFRRQLSYVKSALNDRVESTDTSNRDWIKEKLSFDAAYENGRVVAYLFLPRNTPPPYQLVVYFPGLTSFAGRASSDNLQPQPGITDFIVKGGRAIVWPIYKGSYERWDTFLNLQGEESLRTYRARMFQWRQDLGRILDLMSARKEIDVQRVAYVGASFGASMALPLLALEDRLKVVVLLAPGVPYRVLPPEADAVNYLSHITLPVLMVGGRHDYVFPVEESQKPLFERLGTPPDHKRHVVYEDAGHGSGYPRSQMIREVLGWLDKYLGPVNGFAVAH
jgi:dienelactone hydrolase